jgi:antitoxin component of RelBE/YafQ-DinJ toxin-antitoxin module
MAIKDAEIKVRLTKDQKELIKKVAKAQGMSMSEFIVVTTENMARKKEGNIKSQKMIEDRAMGIEKKLLEITERIRGNNDKKMLPKRRRFMFWVW